MIATLGLILIVCACLASHAFAWLLRTLRLDGRDALLYLGLAEVEFRPIDSFPDQT